MTSERYFRFLVRQSLSLRSEYPTFLETRRRVLERFYDVFPAPRPAATGQFGAIHDRILQGPDQKRLSEFLAWLDREGRQGKASDDRPRTEASAYAEAASAFYWVGEKIVRKPPPEQPSEARPSARAALNAFAVLEDSLRHGHSAPGLVDARIVLIDTIAAWHRDVDGATQDAKCPNCGQGTVFELNASNHIAHCEGHPGNRRLVLARVAVQFAATCFNVVIPSEQVQTRHAPGALALGWAQHWQVEKVPDYLFSPHAEPFEHPKVQDSLAALRTVVTEWAHFSDRKTDPCPWCGAVTSIEEFASHLRACERHPAAQQAQVIEDAIERAGGHRGRALVNLVSQRVGNRIELAFLLKASRTFVGDMGWSGSEGYSDKYTEAPWRAAMARAEKYLGLTERKRPKRRAGSSAARGALEQLLKTPCGPPEADALAMTTLRLASTQLDAWCEQHSFMTTCPACERAGVHLRDLQKHLETCPLHPAVRAYRVADAGRAGESIGGAPAPMTQFYPRMVNRSRTYDISTRESSLAALQKLDPSELGSTDSDRLWTFIEEWEEMARFVEGHCEWCAEPAYDEHFLTCSKHPLASGSSLPRATDAVGLAFGKLRMEADVCLVALAKLSDACSTFWNSMRDGEDGKSLSSPELDTAFEQACEAAQASLETIAAEIGH